MSQRTYRFDQLSTDVDADGHIVVTRTARAYSQQPAEMVAAVDAQRRLTLSARADRRAVELSRRSLSLRRCRWTDAMYERVYKLKDGTRIRTKIRANFYRFQSSGTVERWDGSQWQEMIRRSGDALTCWESASRALALREPLSDETFEPDVTEMDAEAWAILTDP